MSTCIVVGAGEGVSGAVARRFAADGFSVGLVTRDSGKLERLAGTIGPGVEVAVADAGDAGAVTSALAELQAATGPCDVLVYNAARATPGAAHDVTAADLAASLAVDVVGAVAATEAVLPAMLERRAGTLLFTGGGLALSPAAALGALSVGKAALRAWALALHADLAPLGVHAATVTIAGFVAPGTRFDPDAIAEEYAALHTQAPADWEAERVVR